MEESNKHEAKMFPIIKACTELLTANGVSIDSMVALRRDLHKHAEIAFKEFRTQRIIKENLIQIGIPEDKIKACAITGLVVDIEGTGKVQEPGPMFTIALRAEIDALPMEELNDDFEYKSITGCAHACGHDGHIASLLTATTIIAKSRHLIPANKRIRLLFQPAEESPGGAKPMIEEGALEGVDEVYGYHNRFTPLGLMSVMPGATMAKVIIVYIKITGKGGHGSTPEKCRDPILAGSHINIALSNISTRDVNALDCAVFTVCKMTGGSANNVIPETCTLEGTIRIYSKEAEEIIVDRIFTIATDIAESFDCKADVIFNHLYPSVINTSKETENVRRVGRLVLGEEMVTTQGIPSMGSEDFSFFLQVKPGAFFFLGNHNSARGATTIPNHSGRYDFNDNLIPLAGVIWLRLVEDRFGVKIIHEILN